MGDYMDIQKIAKELGISVSSVSRALNDKEGVSEKLRQEIKDFAKLHNYQPSIFGKNLASKQKNSVAITLKNTDLLMFPWFAFIYQAIVHEAKTRGFFVDLLNYAHMQHMANQFSGVIVLDGESFQDIDAVFNLPTVFIGGEAKGFRVCNHDYDGAYHIADHLIKLNCQKFYHIGQSTGSFNAIERYKGYTDRLQESNLTLTKLTMPSIKHDEIAAYQTILDHYKNHKPQGEAIICYNDQIAQAVLEALAFLHIQSTKDVKVTGYDGLPIYTNEIITAVQDIKTIAHTAFELLAQAKGKDQMQSIKIPPTIKNKY